MMSLGYVTEPARHVPVIRRTDVLVVGSGPGGLAAALAAARAGVEVTLVERFGCFGGKWVSPSLTYRSNVGEIAGFPMMAR